MIILTCRSVYAEKLHSACFIQCLRYLQRQSLQERVFPSCSHSPVGTGHWLRQFQCTLFSVPPHSNALAVRFAGLVFSPDACFLFLSVVGNGKFSLMEIWLWGLCCSCNEMCWDSLTMSVRDLFLQA